MKKIVLFLGLILTIIISICIVKININSKTSIAILKENNQYEQYLKDEIFGTDVITLINRAESDNIKNNVPKDEKGFYTNNYQNSIQIDLIMITNEEKQETTRYRMEAISKVGITEFIKNFNTQKFKCTKKEYHKQTGKISYIEISQSN